MSLDSIILVIGIIFFAVIPTLKSRTIAVKKLAVSPLIFLYFLYHSLSSNFKLVPISIFYVLSGIVLGTGFGILSRLKTVIQSDHLHKLVHLPGTYNSLISFVLIFSLHFIIGYLKAVKPEYFIHNNLGNEIFILLLSLTSSLSLGSNLWLYYKYKITPSTLLKN